MILSHSSLSQSYSSHAFTLLRFLLVISRYPSPNRSGLSSHNQQLFLLHCRSVSNKKRDRHHVSGRMQCKAITNPRPIQPQLSIANIAIRIGRYRNISKH